MPICIKRRGLYFLEYGRINEIELQTCKKRFFFNQKVGGRHATRLLREFF